MIFHYVEFIPFVLLRRAKKVEKLCGIFPTIFKFLDKNNFCKNHQKYKKNAKFENFISSFSKFSGVNFQETKA